MTEHEVYQKVLHNIKAGEWGQGTFGSRFTQSPICTQGNVNFVVYGNAYGPVKPDVAKARLVGKVTMRLERLIAARSLYRGVVNWNDSPGVTKKDVVKLILDALRETEPPLPETPEPPKRRWWQREPVQADRTGHEFTLRR